MRRRHGGVDERLQGLGAQKGRVAAQHQDLAIFHLRLLKGGMNGVARAQALLLQHALDVGVAGEERLHLLGAVAHHDDAAVDTRSAGSVDDPPDHGLAQNLVDHLGAGRLHARALTCGQNNSGDSHVSSFYGPASQTRPKMSN